MEKAEKHRECKLLFYRCHCQSCHSFVVILEGKFHVYMGQPLTLTEICQAVQLCTTSLSSQKILKNRHSIYKVHSKSSQTGGALLNYSISICCYGGHHMFMMHQCAG